MYDYAKQLFSGVAITQSDTTEYTKRPLKAIIILTADASSADTIKITDVEGVAHTLTLPLFAAGAAYPITIPIAATKVWATGTTLEDAEMIGIR